ncbi:MAG: hypothetical protein HPY85_10335 [Anaerolineae bacterium]|nr:hypothetical protein [Anaerolineae bacterium]
MKTNKTEKRMSTPKTPENNFLSMQVPSPYREELAAITQEDLRSRPNTILLLIHQEYLRRHPDGLPVETGSTSMQVESDLHRG